MRPALNLLLACGFCLAATFPLRAEEFTYLRLEKVKKSDVVVTRVSRIRGDRYILDLGYVHGVRLGNRFLVRPNNGAYSAQGIVTVTYTSDSFSLADISNGDAPAIGDLCFISARELDLWNGRPRSDTARSERTARQERRGGYDSREIGTALSMEILTDDYLTRYEEMRGGIQREMASQDRLRIDSYQLTERMARVTGHQTVDNGQGRIPSAALVIAAEDRNLSRAVFRAAGALGLQGSESGYGDHEDRVLKQTARRYRTELLRNILSDLGPDLSTSELATIDAILTEVIQKRVSGDLSIQGAVDMAQTLLRRDLPELTNTAMWTRFISEVTELVKAQKDAQ